MLLLSSLILFDVWCDHVTGSYRRPPVFHRSDNYRFASWSRWRRREMTLYANRIRGFSLDPSAKFALVLWDLLVKKLFTVNRKLPSNYRLSPWPTLAMHTFSSNYGNIKHEFEFTHRIPPMCNWRFGRRIGQLLTFLSILHMNAFTGVYRMHYN